MDDTSDVFASNISSQTNVTLSYVARNMLDISHFWLSLLSIPAIKDSIRLFLLGLAIESTRRLLMLVYTNCVDSFFITAEFDERDETFTWMMFWLSRHPAFSSSRYIRVTSHRFGQSGIADCLPGEAVNGMIVDSTKCVQYMPAHDKPHHMWHKGTWMSIKRSQTQGDMWNRKGDERLILTIFAWRISALDGLLLEAKLCYKRDSEGRIKIHVSDTYNEWQVAGSRPKRSLSSVVLDKGIKEHLLSDVKEFLGSEKWYAERGIPWRRGYLLYGSPGAGKTSIIYALAGELDLDIYLVSLSKKGLDDSTLNELITKIPSRSLVLMEDIDAAFFRGINREGTASVGDAGPESESPGQESQSASAVTLSGLLGAIDGVAAQEGRVLFATTNKYSALDAALVRPGRLDVHVCFENAGKWQAEELFRCFFPANAEKSRGANSKANGNNEFQPHIGSYSLTQDELDALARQFAECIPEREFSMAAIQGLLMQYKTRPRLAADEVSAWVESERKRRGVVRGESTRPDPNEAEAEKVSEISFSNNDTDDGPNLIEKSIQTDDSDDAESFEGNTTPD